MLSERPRRWACAGGRVAHGVRRRRVHHRAGNAVQAEVAELVDAPDSKSGARKGVGVRFPPSAFRTCTTVIRRVRGIRSGARVVAAGVVGCGLALVAAGCGTSEAAACARVEYPGTGAPDLVLVSSLPLRGPFRAESAQINDAIRAQLKTRRFKAGDHTIGFQACDDSTAAAGGSDPGQCAENAERVCGRREQGDRSDRSARFAVRARS